jgi:helix-turn-helix protein
MSELFTIKQVAERLGQTPKRLLRQSYLGKIAYQRFGRVKMFRSEDIQEFVERTRVNAKWFTNEKTEKAGGIESMTASRASEFNGMHTLVMRFLNKRLNLSKVFLLRRLSII